jgi:hypothetical protein
MRALLAVCATGVLLAPWSGFAAAAVPFVHETVDVSGNVGEYSSLAIDSRGNPHIAYFDRSSWHLKYAVKAGGVWSTETADATFLEGEGCSIALDAQDNPHISYFANSIYDLKYAVKVAGVWMIETAVAAGDVGWQTSLALDSQGNPHISHFDVDNSALLYTYKAGGLWWTETVDDVGWTGEFSSIAVDDHGKIHISYHNDTSGDLLYAHRSGTGWALQTVDSDPSVGEYTSLALDAQGRPSISYYDLANTRLKYAEWNAGWSVEVVYDAGNAGQYTSLALDADGNPHIGFYGGTAGGLRYAVRRGGTWTIEVVDGMGARGPYNSIALDAQGNPCISYYDGSFHVLRYTDSAVHVVSPSGGETWPVGAERTIEWSGAGVVDVLLSVDGGQTYELLEEGISSNRLSLRVPHTPSRFASVQVRRSDPLSTAESDSFFTVEADIALLSLRAELLADGGAAIEWQSDPGPEDLAGYRLEKAAGNSWRTLVALTRTTQHLDAEGGAGARYRLFGVNGFGDELLLGETTVTPGAQLAAWPLPYCQGTLNISYATRSGWGGGVAETDVALFNLSGRRVRTLERGFFEAGHRMATWDGTDDAGARVNPGIYFLRCQSGGEDVSLKVVVMQ